MKFMLVWLLNQDLPFHYEVWNDEAIFSFVIPDSACPDLRESGIQQQVHCVFTHPTFPS